MTVEYVIGLGQQVFVTALYIALPILGIGVAVGVLVAIFQAATQIQEASLNFLPKVLAMGVGMMIFGPWIIEKLTSFTITMIQSIQQVGGG